MSEAAVFRKTLQMGLGEALERLINLHSRVSNGIGTDADKAERRLILDALNEQKLDLGFDCDLDGVPDTIAIFAQSATTSCCRLLPTDTSRRAAPAPKRARTKTPSRRKRKPTKKG